MKVLVLISLIGLAIPTNGYAQKKKGKKRSKSKSSENASSSAASKSKTDKASGEVEGQADTSAGIRATKRFGVAGLFTPLSDFVLQYGAGGFYSISSDLQVGFNFLLGSKDLTNELSSDEVVDITEADLSGMALYALGRYFIGNSFNVSGGIGIRNGTGKLMVKSAIGPEYMGLDFSVSSVTLPVAIGNHWSFGNLNIGVDWLAYMIAVAGSYSSSIDTNAVGANDPTLASLNTSFEKLGQDLSTLSSLTLALLQVGFQF